MNSVKLTPKNFAYNISIFLLLVPTLVLVTVFSYTPAIEAMRHCFYIWDGDYVEEFVGLNNFRKLIGDLSLWTPLLLGGTLAFLSALCATGTTRVVLRIAGISCLVWMVLAMSGDYNKVRATLEWRTGTLTLLVVMMIITVIAVVMSFSRTDNLLRKWSRFLAFFLPVAGGAIYLITVRELGDGLLWLSFRLIFILIIANLFKMWPSIFTAVCIHRLKSERFKYLYRVLFVVPMIIPSIVELLIWKFFYDPNVGVLNKILNGTGLNELLIWIDGIFKWNIFVDKVKPVWLGDPSLIIPSLIFWGFPWVGVVGVLIYLSGLQNISESVYEAAELDGVGWWGKFFYIELPLIMTQIRLNLILMVIGTFQAYGFQLILLGPEGGPQNKGLTPGLYMYYKAFLEQEYGYACAIGLILFFIILFCTILNQRFVRNKA